MLSNLASCHKPYFKISAGIPSDYNGLLLSGAHTITASCEFGKIVIQECKIEKLNIQLSSFYFSKKMSIEFETKSKAFNALFSFKNNFTFINKGFENINLLQGQHLLLFLAGKPATLVFKKGHYYELFNIIYPEEIIFELSHYFPELLKPFMGISKHANALVFSKPIWDSGGLYSIPQKIIDAPYEGELRRYYLENKVRENLFLLLAQTETENSKAVMVSSDGRRRIMAIARLLKSKLQQYFPIPQLARKARMNENKLQLLFKEVFGKGIYEYQREERLLEAKRLILEKQIQIKEVYAMVGYQSISAFITEFKKYFGYSPGSLKKTADAK